MITPKLQYIYNVLDLDFKILKIYREKELDNSKSCN